MRRLLSALAVLALLVAPARASETARHNVLSRMFTTNDWFGMPASSGDPFTCNAGAIRSMYYDTATDTVKFCNGSAWSGLGGVTSPVSGDYVWTGKATFGSAADAANSVRMGDTAGCIAFEGSSADASETLLCATNPTADVTFNTPNASAGTYSLLTTAAAVTVAQGGTGLATGTSGGVPYFSGSTTIASSGALTANALVKGGGAGVAPSASGITDDGTAVVSPSARTLTTGALGINGSTRVASTAKVDIWFNAPTGMFQTLDASNNLAPSQFNGLSVFFGSGLGNTQAGLFDASQNFFIGNGGTTGVANVPAAGKFAFVGASGSNAAGVRGVFQASASTGTATSGDLAFQRVPTTQSSGSTANTATDAFVIFSKSVDLTGGSATAVVSFGVPSGSSTGGQITYTVEANDGTDFQSRAGAVNVQAVNKAGTETCVVSTATDATPSETEDGSSPAASSGTLTYAWTVDTSGTNTCQLKLNAVSSLTETVLRITFQVHKNGGLGLVTSP